MTKHYGLLGFPLSHSFSALYFAEKFRAEKIEACYRNYEIASVEEVRKLVTQELLSGINVTIPHKQAILPLLDTVSEEAAAIGAVNVVRVVRCGKDIRLEGYNTDVVGFRRSLRPLLEAHHQRALVLGTGGASRAVVYALRQLGIEVRCVSRTAKEGVATYEELTPEIMATHCLIVNCTPLGTYPDVDTCPPLPYDFLSEEHLLYDLVYNPAETLFLRKGKERGAATKNGHEMLVLQAEAAWSIWNEEAL